MGYRIYDCSCRSSVVNWLTGSVEIINLSEINGHDITLERAGGSCTGVRLIK